MRSSRRVARVLMLAAMSWPAASFAGADVPDAGLCHADEQVAFSCPVAAKTVSLCTAGTGRIAALTYRYGRPGRIENEFVARPDNDNRFFATVSPARPGASVNQVWFDRKGVRYLLTECVGGNCPKQAGLAVLRGERVVMNARCTRVTTDDHASFAHDLVTFGSDAGTSRSSTGLLVIEDADNALDRVYPAGPGR